MNSITDRLRIILNNPHTSVSAVIVALCQVLSIWIPQYKGQLDETSRWALAYAVLMAGDARPKNGTAIPIVTTPDTQTTSTTPKP